MLRNILKSCIILPFFMLITSCAVPAHGTAYLQVESLQKSDLLSPDLHIYDAGTSAPPEDTFANDTELPQPEIPERIAALDAQFAASHPEPNGSNASMTAYATDYLEFWQSEVNSFILAFPELYDDYTAFSATLEDGLNEYAESFRVGDAYDAVYGREIVFALPMRLAERLRWWLAGAITVTE